MPVGGSKEGDIPIIAGDTFVDKPSGKPVRVHSGLVSADRVEPSAGGYQSLLDATVMACEARVLDALREYKEAVHIAGEKSFCQFFYCFINSVRVVLLRPVCC